MKVFRRAAIFILLLTVPMVAYVPRRMQTPSGVAFEKWSDSAFPIAWSVNSAPSGNISGTRSLLETARAAFASWSSVPTAKVSFTEGPSSTATATALDGANVLAVSSNALPGGVAALTIFYSYSAIGNDPLGRTIAFPGQILEADILLSPNAAFSTDVIAAAGRIHLESQLRHEIGHFLGLDHSGLSSAVMFPAVEPGVVRLLTPDDEIGLSILYPAPTFWTSRGAMRGVVKTASGAAVFGAHVVVANSQGIAVASTLSAADGEYQVVGLEPGSYSAYAEPLDLPLKPADVETLAPVNPNQTVNQSFTTRFAASPASALPSLTLTKTGGDNQVGTAGQMLSNLLEVEIRDAGNAVKPGVTVTFRAISGGGAVVPIEAVTDAQGKARTRAFLGQGQTQTFRATAANASVDLSAALQFGGGTPAVQNVDWIGGASAGPTDWFVAANWSNATIPDSTRNARISPTAKTQPVLTAPAAVKNLTVDSGANVSTAGFILTASGNVDAVGEISGTGQVRMTGNNVTAKGNFPNIAIAGLVRAAGAINTSGNLEVEIGATLDIASIRVTVTGNVLSSGAVIGNYGFGNVDSDNGHVFMTGSNATVRGSLHTLRIAGNVHANGPVNLTGDLILESGTFFVDGQTVAVDGVFNSWFGLATPAASLVMQNSADVLRVKHLKGDSSMGFTLGDPPSPNKLTAGLLEVADNFSTQGPFETSGTHKIKLVGQSGSGQRVGSAFQSFSVQDLELANTGTMRLTRLTVKGTLRLAGTGSVVLEDAVTVNGALNITGSGPVTSDGNPAVGPGDRPLPGKLVVNGSLDAAAAANVTVDLIELSGAFVRGFSGFSPRMIEFRGVDQSIPAGPSYKTVLWISMSSVALPDGLNMQRFIFFPVDPNATVSLAGNVNVSSRVFVHSGKLNLNGKTLTTGLMTNQCYAFYDDGVSFLPDSEIDRTCSGSKLNVLGALVMQNSSDVLQVAGAFRLFRCLQYPESTFSAGLLEVGGDFQVDSNCGSVGLMPVLAATGTHKVRFNGIVKQQVRMSEYYGVFQNVEIANGAGVRLDFTVVVKGTLSGSFSPDPAIPVPPLAINGPPSPTIGGVCVVFTNVTPPCTSTSGTIKAKVTFASNASSGEATVTGRVGLSCNNCLLPSHLGLYYEGTSVAAAPSGTLITGQFGFGNGALDFQIKVPINVTALTGAIRVALQDFFGQGPVDIPVDITVNKNGAPDSGVTIAP